MLRMRPFSLKKQNKKNYFLTNSVGLLSPFYCYDFPYFSTGLNINRRYFSSERQKINLEVKLNKKKNTKPVISNNLKSYLGTGYFSYTAIKLYKHTPRGSGKGSGNNWTKYLTIKRFIVAFISLIVCAMIKFLIFPLIIAYFPELPEMIEYLIIGVLFIPIKLMVRGVVEGVIELLPRPIHLDDGDGGNSMPPTSTVVIEPLSSTTVGSQQSPTQIDAGQSPPRPRFWPAAPRPLSPRPAIHPLDITVSINRSIRASRLHPPFILENIPNLPRELPYQPRYTDSLQADLRTNLTSSIEVMRDLVREADQQLAHEKLIRVQSMFHCLKVILEDNSNGMLYVLRSFQVHENQSVRSSIEYKKAYAEAHSYFNSDEYKAGKTFAKELAREMCDIHKQRIRNDASYTDSQKGREVVIEKLAQINFSYNKLEKEWNNHFVWHNPPID